jgi:hypothetical protein
MSLSGWGGTATVPFTENFETPLGDYWSFEGSWGATTTLAHGGTTSLTDSPGATYANSTDTAAYLEVDLAGTTSPYLSFWHRYALESWADYGYVEVSNDGRQSWRRVFFVTGFGPNNWSNVRIHLFDFAGQQITIRFRLYTNESNYYDGWYVDDVEVKDEQAQFAVPWKAGADPR